MGAKVEKVAKSDFQNLKVPRLQGVAKAAKAAKAAKSDFFASTLFGRGGRGGGGLNFSKMVQLIFTKLVSHFGQLSGISFEITKQNIGHFLLPR